jgi:adenylate kinase family enzyme
MSAEDGVSALILLLVGLPAAGKSSLASRLQEIATLPLASSTSSLRVYLISYDKKFTEVIRKGDYPSDFFSSQLWQESR